MRRSPSSGWAAHAPPAAAAVAGAPRGPHGHRHGGGGADERSKKDSEEAVSMPKSCLASGIVQEQSCAAPSEQCSAVHFFRQRF